MGGGIIITPILQFSKPRTQLRGLAQSDGPQVAEPGLKCRQESRAQTWNRSALPACLASKRWFNGKDRSFLFRPEMTRVNR